MKLSGKSLDLHLVKEMQLQMLFGTCDEISEWIPALARELEMDVETLESLLDELRVFFALAQIAIRSRVMIPGHEPTQPPPKLERLWRTMSADRRKVDKFIMVTELPDAFRYQQNPPLNRRCDQFKARIVMSLGEPTGIPVNPSLWII